MASIDLRKELECPICLNIYKDPVNLQCGHNYCRECINLVLDTQENSGDYSCPECRLKSQSRPALHRNIRLRNIVENMSSTWPGDEESGTLCTYCIHFSVPAVKSCLLCEAYLCDSHLKVHSKSPEHVISDTITSLENRKCQLHKKILEYYCTEDETCVCVYCLVGEHTGHRKESLDEASEKKKKKMVNVLGRLRTKRDETEKRVQSLKEQQGKVEEKAVGDIKRVTALFGGLRAQVEDLEKKVLWEISRRAKRVSSSMSDLIQQLEIKKEELSKKMDHIVEMCNMTDPLTVLLESDKIDLCDEEGNGTERHNKPKLNDGDIDVAGILQSLHTISDMVTGVGVYFHTETLSDIFLDPNTAGYIDVSNDKKTASWSNKKHPDTPGRFHCAQVFSCQKFSSGRHCWEVDVGASSCRIGMCYPSIERNEWPQLLIGYNWKSWCLQKTDNDDRYIVIHANKEVQLPAKVSSNKVRICLDYEAGQLSFYEMCEPVRHLHTFSTTFTEPLHAVLWLGSGYVKLNSNNWLH
ncbi:E3 ubiquitin/ISG15 ligase TRIM25-like [Pyxicephalus adspersus]|uniref:E3 ubiquitin/ISG15 ligase TRIM25-like n=1 Tax=Pyxicephalus adspersus TaxID=30357 RepID=UPI003B5B66C9